MHERKEAANLGSAMESYSESILVSSPKTNRAALQSNLDTRPTSTVLYSATQDVDVVRGADKWDAKTQQQPREKGRYTVSPPSPVVSREADC